MSENLDCFNMNKFLLMLKIVKRSRLAKRGCVTQNYVQFLDIFLTILPEIASDFGQVGFSDAYKGQNNLKIFDS